MKYQGIAGGILASLFIWGCAMPRQTMMSAQVAPQGHLTFGYESGMQLPSVVMDNFDDSTLDVLADMVTQDTTDASDTLLHKAGRMALAQGLDPLGGSSSLFIAYGLLDGMEVGYEYLGTGHGLWVRYQVMAAPEGELTGTLGFNASMQNYDLPSFMGNVQEALGYRFKRKDFTIPFAIGRLNRGELFSGEWAAVLQMQWSHVTYAFEPTTVYRVVEGVDQYELLKQVPEQSSSFLSYGGAVNGRLGIGPVFLGCGIGYYYQNYGDFMTLGGRTESLAGGTIVAHGALELRLWK